MYQSDVRGFKSVRILTVYCLHRDKFASNRFYVVVFLQKSRSNGGRWNNRKVGGWIHQAPELRLQVAAEEVPHQGGL